MLMDEFDVSSTKARAAASRRWQPVARPLGDYCREDPRCQSTLVELLRHSTSTRQIGYIRALI